VACGALASALPAAATRPGAPPSTGTLSVTPAVLATVAVPGTQLAPLAVLNGTAVPFTIRIYPALADQRLDGGLVPRVQPRQLAAARRLVSIAPARVVLRPGKRFDLRPRLLAFARSRPTANVVAVIEASPPATAVGGAHVRIRLLAALLVRSQNAPAPRARVERVRVFRGARRGLALVARVRNTGAVAEYEQLKIAVKDAQGRVVATAKPPVGLVMPGFRRDFRATITRRLRAGKYHVVATGQFGKAANYVVARFALNSSNELSH
jgi:hypothetical protein